MAQARTELIHCDNCGEDYAATYRRCPYCNARRPRRLAAGAEPDYEPDEELEHEEHDHSAHRGGKRLSGGGGGGRKDGPDIGYWVKLALYILSALVILAAIWIMCTMVIPKFFPAQPQPSAAPTETVTQAPAPTPTVAPTPAAVDDDPLGLDSPDLPTVEPDPIATQAPVATQAPIATQTPVATTTAAPVSPGGAKLSSSDFSITAKYPDPVQLTVSGGQAASWKSSNTSVATVSDSGKVTGVGNGTATITCSLSNGGALTCVVRVSGMNATAAPATPAPATAAPATAAPASTGGATLSSSDFSITATYPDPVQLTVSGGQAASWKSSNTSVATVSDNGKVTGVGNGYAVITCTLSSGSTLKCDVHVSGK